MLSYLSCHMTGRSLHTYRRGWCEVHSTCGDCGPEGEILCAVCGWELSQFAWRAMGMRLDFRDDKSSAGRSDCYSYDLSGKVERGLRVSGVKGRMRFSRGVGAMEKF